MTNDKERNAIATEIYESLKNSRLKNKLDWVDSTSFTIDDRLEASNVKEINDIVEKCKDTKLIDWQISVLQRQTSNKHYRHSSNTFPVILFFPFLV